MIAALIEFGFRLEELRRMPAAEARWWCDTVTDLHARRDKERPK